MADPVITHTSLSVYVRQIKETSFEQDASGAYNQATELPGFLEVCVDVEGVPWVIARRKAPGLLADIERLKTANPPVVPTPTPTAAQV
jgi:hypothetical protein